MNSPEAWNKMMGCVASGTPIAFDYKDVMSVLEFVSWMTDQAKENGRQAAQEPMLTGGERRELIRRAAIELAAVYRGRDPILHMARADGEMAWNAARLLWDTKPEDC